LNEYEEQRRDKTFSQLTFYCNNSTTVICKDKQKDLRILKKKTVQRVSENCNLLYEKLAIKQAAGIILRSRSTIKF